MNIYETPKSSIETETSDIDIRRSVVRVIIFVCAGLLFIPSLVTYKAANLYGYEGNIVNIYGVFHLLIGGFYSLSFLPSLYFCRWSLVFPFLGALAIVGLNWWFRNGDLSFIFDNSWKFLLAPVVFYFLLGKSKKYT